MTTLISKELFFLQYCQKLCIFVQLYHTNNLLLFSNLSFFFIINVCTYYKVRDLISLEVTSTYFDQSNKFSEVSSLELSKKQRTNTLFDFTEFLALM